MENDKIVIANWKMKLSLKESRDLALAYRDKFKDVKMDNLGVCPNFISLLEIKDILKETNFKIGAQDVFWEKNGAYTGEVSASMLFEAGCKYVIIGHSERRKYLMENYEIIHKELMAVLDVEGLVPVVCLGENWEERKTDRRDFVLYEQLKQSLTGITPKGGQMIILAYEPIWAIGSGTAIEPAEAEYAHKIIKMTLSDMYGKDVVEKHFRIIYGGSINSKNVKGIVSLNNIDGVLVGGASLEANEFYDLTMAVINN